MERWITYVLIQIGTRLRFFFWISKTEMNTPNLVDMSTCVSAAATVECCSLFLLLYSIFGQTKLHKNTCTTATACAMHWASDFGSFESDTRINSRRIAIFFGALNCTEFKRIHHCNAIHVRCGMFWSEENRAHEEKCSNKRHTSTERKILWQNWLEWNLGCNQAVIRSRYFYTKNRALTHSLTKPEKKIMKNFETKWALKTKAKYTSKSTMAVCNVHHDCLWKCWNGILLIWDSNWIWWWWWWYYCDRLAATKANSVQQRQS